MRESLVPGISASDLDNGSFYKLLQDRYDISVVGGVQTVEPTVTNEEESELLGVPLYSPAFLFERITRSSSGEVVEYVRSIYRGDRYRLVTELGASRVGSAGASPTLRPTSESGLDNWHLNMSGSPRGQVV